MRPAVLGKGPVSQVTNCGPRRGQRTIIKRVASRTGRLAPQLECRKCGSAAGLIEISGTIATDID